MSCLLLSPPAISEQKVTAFYVQPPGLGYPSAAEYYSTDPNNRILVPINIWGELKRSGKHFVPAGSSLDEVLTLFHEFGHALHGALNRCDYLTTAEVAWDFVELPSQIMENWATHPDVLATYAKHFQTGEKIPQELLAKMEASEKFNQGFVTTEYLAASILDMDYHTLTEVGTLNVHEFEKNSMDRIGLIDEIIPRYRSTYFRHIFNGGYSAGYYSYIWAEVLDKDAFNAFVETSLFDQEVATSFRQNILEKGSSEEEMRMYIKFRGKEPTIEPLLKGRGLL